MSQVNCSHCRESLSSSHVGECPKCGKTGRTVILGTAIETDIALPISWSSVKEYYETDKKAHVSVIIITAVSPFVGLFIAGWVGVFVGVLLGVGSYFLGPKAIIKVREIRKGQ